MKTIVACKHAPGPAVNGFDGCHARLGEGGLCPGVKTARWLNELGDDDEPYGTLKRVTNGEVRDNWIRASGHIVAVDEELARLSESRRRLMRELRYVNEQIKRYSRRAVA